jgi:hypothetical protein
MSILLALLGGAPATQTFTAAGIASTEIFGGAKDILVERATGIPGAEAFGGATDRLVQTAAGGVSGEAVSSPSDALIEHAAGIASAEVFGLPALVGGEAEVAPGGGAGVPIRSYVVGRKRWKDIQEAIAAEREAAQRANELLATDRKIARGAIKQAAQAITAVKESDRLPAELEDMTAALEAAASARTTAEVLRQVQLAADYAQAVIAELYQEEEEAIMLLLAA